MRHSPGPWRSRYTGHERVLIEDERGAEVALVIRGPDARLIAESPALLAAVKRGLTYRAHDPPCDGGCDECEDRALVRRIEEGGR